MDLAFLGSSPAGYLAIAMITGGLAFFVYLSFTARSSPLQGVWMQYTSKLDEELRFLLWRTKSSQIAGGQVAVAALSGALYAGMGETLFLGVALLALIAPYYYIKGQSTERVETLEKQLDSWMLLLANSLKATPALGEAMKSTVTLIASPMADEIDLIVKENALGTPLDRAIVNATDRMRSPVIAGALTTVLVARQTGGDVPTILETSAASLREMQRLEGVIRTKTAEGKGQTVVLGATPFVLMGMLYLMDENWFTPLFSTGLGKVIMSIALALWISAIAWSVNILDVDY